MPAPRSTSLLLAALALLVAPPSSHAGTYTLEVCPAGSTSPSPLVTAYSGVSQPTCTNGTLSVRFNGDRVAPNSPAGIVVRSPPAAPDSRISAIQAAATIAAKTGDGNSSGRLQADMAPGDLSGLLPSWGGGAHGPFGPAHLDFKYAQPASVRRLLVECDSQCDFSATAPSHLSLSSFEVQLTDDNPPTVELSPTGLLSPGPKAGRQSLGLRIHDAASGASTYVLSGKGRDGGTYWVDRSLGCGMPDALGGCTTSADVDTGRLAAGTQTLTLTAWDRAGNKTEVSTPPVFVWHENWPRSPDTAPLQLTGHAKRKVVTTFGSKPTNIGGRLLDVSGVPLADAEVHVLETRLTKGSPRTRVAVLMTDPNGSFQFSRPADSSADVEIAVPVHRGADDYDTVKRIRVRVLAGVTLRTSTKTVARGRAVTFSGALKAPSTQIARQDVVIQVRSAYGWQDVRILRTTRNGRFAWKHTFRRAGQFKFRARVRSSETLSVSPNESLTVALRVR